LERKRVDLSEVEFRIIGKLSVSPYENVLLVPFPAREPIFALVDVQNASDKVYICRIERERKKRSLDANARCWATINEIANVLRVSKEEVYLEMLKRYGQSEIVSIKSSVDVSGYLKYYEPIGKGTVNGQEFTHYKVYKGSSEFDTREMSILIDGINSEAKELGIEIMPPQEIKELLKDWSAKNE
jgi:hypothetical protein